MPYDLDIASTASQPLAARCGRARELLAVDALMTSATLVQKVRLLSQPGLKTKTCGFETTDLCSALSASALLRSTAALEKEVRHRPGRRVRGTGYPITTTSASAGLLIHCGPKSDYPQ